MRPYVRNPSSTPAQNGPQTVSRQLLQKLRLVRGGFIITGSAPVEDHVPAREMRVTDTTQTLMPHYNGQHSVQ